MDDVQVDLFQLPTGILHDAPVDIVERAVGSRARDESRDRLHEQSEVMFTLTKCLFRPPLIIDVREQTVPSDNAASIVEKGLRADVDPPVDAIEAPHAMIKVQRLSECVDTAATRSSASPDRPGEWFQIAEIPSSSTVVPDSRESVYWRIRVGPSELATAIMPGTLSMSWRSSRSLSRSASSARF